MGVSRGERARPWRRSLATRLRMRSVNRLPCLEVPQLMRPAELVICVGQPVTRRVAVRDRPATATSRSWSGGQEVIDLASDDRKTGNTLGPISAAQRGKPGEHLPSVGLAVITARIRGGQSGPSHEEEAQKQEQSAGAQIKTSPRRLSPKALNRDRERAEAGRVGDAVGIQGHRGIDGQGSTAQAAACRHGDALIRENVPGEGGVGSEGRRTADLPIHLAGQTAVWS